MMIIRRQILYGKNECIVCGDGSCGPYMNAAGQENVSHTTLSDHVFTGEALSAEDRQTPSVT